MEEGNAAKNLPVVQIVQDAYLADYKSGPKRATWAMVTFVVAFIFTTIFLILQGILHDNLNCEQKIKDSIIKFLKAIKP
jgi:uncharacterized protein involved in exopolysaccharide biosynthesis